jgi:hypothetical protein
MAETLRQEYKEPKECVTATALITKFSKPEEHTHSYRYLRRSNPS